MHGCVYLFGLVCTGGCILPLLAGGVLYELEDIIRYQSQDVTAREIYICTRGASCDCCKTKVIEHCLKAAQSTGFVGVCYIESRSLLPVMRGLDLRTRRRLRNRVEWCGATCCSAGPCASVRYILCQRLIYHRCEKIEAVDLKLCQISNVILLTKQD